MSRPEIIKAFNDLGYSPLENQAETVEQIISAFESGKKNVFLHAPTGSGKSLFHISRKHRTIYTQLTIMRMNQALGRSTRGRGDKSVTYMLDENCKKLFRSSLNDCRHQFTVVDELALIPYNGE
jgi:Rad3-related DNA helicase